MSDGDRHDASSGERLAALLTRLAGEQALGAVQVRHPVGGAIFLSGGRIALAVPSSGPSVEERLRRELGAEPSNLPRRRVQLALTALTVDALAEMVAEAHADPDPEPVFEAGRMHPLGDVRPLAVDAALAEVRRRQALLQRVAPGVTPDTVPVRAESLPGPRIRFSRLQWDLVRAVDGVSSVRALAETAGRGVFATVLDVHRLARLGVLRPADGTQPSAPTVRRELSFLSVTRP